MSAENYFIKVEGFEGPSGGTSAVAPLMAALIAILNQANKQNVGFINPFLYANLSNGVCLDVSSGTNAIKSTIQGYKARKGWDACTGLGTPDGEAILRVLTGGGHKAPAAVATQPSRNGRSGSGNRSATKSRRAKVPK
jgi:kumamolisin